jgi:hypothetical protein
MNISIRMRNPRSSLSAGYYGVAETINVPGIALKGLFPQKPGGLFGQSRVNEKARTPLESSELGKLGDNLEMPVIMLQAPLSKGRRVKSKIIGRKIQDLLQAPQGFRENPSQRFDFVNLTIFVKCGMTFGENPGFKGRKGSKGANHDKFRVFQNYPLPLLDLLMNYVAEDTSFFTIVVISSPGHLLRDQVRDNGQSD